MSIRAIFASRSSRSRWSLQKQQVKVKPVEAVTVCLSFTEPALSVQKLYLLLFHLKKFSEVFQKCQHFLNITRHLQSLWLMHEEYLYGDISLNFSYLAQCLANLEKILKSISDLNRSGLKNHGPPSLYHVFLAESNYKMPQSPILSQRCVIKNRGLSCPCLHQVIAELQKD